MPWRCPGRAGDADAAPGDAGGQAAPVESTIARPAGEHEAGRLRIRRVGDTPGARRAGAAATKTRRWRLRPQPPRTSVARLADYLAGSRIQAQLDVLALCVLGFGLPDAVLEFDVMDLGVACGREPGLDVGLAQVGDL